jgi:hypothetical protein
MTLPSEKHVPCQSSRNFDRSRYESILGDSDDTSDSVIGVTNFSASELQCLSYPGGGEMLADRPRYTRAPSHAHFLRARCENSKNPVSACGREG